METKAKKILESTGRQFVNGGDFLVIQTNYPSLKNLFEDYLVKGGWIPPEEAEQIGIIGYPSKSSNLEEAFGLETLPRKKSPSLRPRRK